MGENVYEKLADVLDTLPSGFPRTQTGDEIKLLEKVFTPEEAELFCKLRLSFETADEIHKRTGMPIEGMEDLLTRMWAKGHLRGKDTGKEKKFKMAPWIIGIYEYQVHTMDQEFTRLNRKFAPKFAQQYFSKSPHVTQVVPIEQAIEPGGEVMPYESVSSIIKNGRSFMVVDCVCRKERQFQGRGCDHPLEVCLYISDDPEEFNEHHTWKGRVLNRQQALEIIRDAEEKALVHNISNTRKGHHFICNCCGCGCGSLILLKMGIMPASQLLNTHYYARIDPDLCTGCGICAQERCQVAAIEEIDNSYRIKRQQCIGCGLCVSACPAKAIRLIRKPAEEQVTPPEDEAQWNEQRATLRGVDYSRFK
jgi:Na+-translocating ferredoxin:NAD+ oxidoreductase subunit B